MFNVMAIGAVLVSMVAPSVTVPGTGPGNVPVPDNIQVKLVSVNGSGCKKDTTAVVVSPDHTAFTVTYNSYLAQAGEGTKPTDARKNCQLAVQVTVPSGFTYAIASADFRGYAALPKGASALERNNYYFQGDPQTVYTEYPIKGNFSDDWETTDTVPVAALVWSPCGAERYFNINTELRASLGTAKKTETAYIEMDSTDGSIQTVYHFAFDTCNHHPHA